MSLAFLYSEAMAATGYDTAEEADYCHSAVRAYVRHMNDADLPQVAYGSSARDYKRAKKARLKAIKEKMASDVCTDFGLDKKEAIGILAGIILFVFGGPLFVVLAVVAAVAEWALEDWLNGKFKGEYSAAADELKALDAMP